MIKEAKKIVKSIENSKYKNIDNLIPLSELIYFACNKNKELCNEVYNHFEFKNNVLEKCNELGL